MNSNSSNGTNTHSKPEELSREFPSRDSRNKSRNKNKKTQQTNHPTLTPEKIEKKQNTKQQNQIMNHPLDNSNQNKDVTDDKEFLTLLKHGAVLIQNKSYSSYSYHSINYNTTLNNNNHHFHYSHPYYQTNLNNNERWGRDHWIVTKNNQDISIFLRFEEIEYYESLFRILCYDADSLGYNYQYIPSWLSKSNSINSNYKISNIHKKKKKNENINKNNITLNRNDFMNEYEKENFKNDHNDDDDKDDDKDDDEFDLKFPGENQLNLSRSQSSEVIGSYISKLNARRFLERSDLPSLLLDRILTIVTEQENNKINIIDDDNVNQNYNSRKNSGYSKEEDDNNNEGSNTTNEDFNYMDQVQTYFPKNTSSLPPKTLQEHSLSSSSPQKSNVLNDKKVVDVNYALEGNLSRMGWFVACKLVALAQHPPPVDLPSSSSSTSNPTSMKEPSKQSKISSKQLSNDSNTNDIQNDYYESIKSIITLEFLSKLSQIEAKTVNKGLHLSYDLEINNHHHHKNNNIKSSENGSHQNNDDDNEILMIKKKIKKRKKTIFK
jgi:hypothetical protein